MLAPKLGQVAQYPYKQTTPPPTWELSGLTPNLLHEAAFVDEGRALWKLLAGELCEKNGFPRNWRRKNHSRSKRCHHQR